MWPRVDTISILVTFCCLSRLCSRHRRKRQRLETSSSRGERRATAHRSPNAQASRPSRATRGTRNLVLVSLLFACYPRARQLQLASICLALAN